ncbi:MAG: hypothetical protein EHM79_05595 [Geobacter sp.]|nr:MAG: hypothetical protein EHM79_05595 [Geobacter sp.]
MRVCNVKHRRGSLTQYGTEVETGTSEDRRIIIGTIRNMSIGLVVDQVSEVIKLPETVITPAPQAVKGFDSAFIKGIGRHGQTLVIILEIEKMFSAGQLEHLEQAA